MWLPPNVHSTHVLESPDKPDELAVSQHPPGTLASAVMVSACFSGPPPIRDADALQEGVAHIADGPDSRVPEEHLLEALARNHAAQGGVPGGGRGAEDVEVQGARART
ncbi:hypothetical protein DL766_009569 [Monosporascus sp. MC13-8B]|uniref:Uncharacterized protein n=1 Tax=Monosporascus cannonballus TaxID=155416 RepID=A0ABY0HHA0_9PEZI|nr:hypothetical protein DL763_009509 [Monosporascus cannonballus]RYO92622.1 hypothetical protein DL762_001525 [Monosporascus cannonballus]RYP14841.1 hypothetical protein DL766_009569 [Monosporascus sp. MC13-8B]